MFLLMVYNLALAKERLNLQEIYHLTTEEKTLPCFGHAKNAGNPGSRHIGPPGCETFGQIEGPVLPSKNGRSFWGNCRY